MSRSGRVKESANGTKPLMSNGTDAAGAAAGSEGKGNFDPVDGGKAANSSHLGDHVDKGASYNTALTTTTDYYRA